MKPRIAFVRTVDSFVIDMGKYDLGRKFYGAKTIAAAMNWLTKYLAQTPACIRITVPK